MLFGVRFSVLFGIWNTLWANLWCLWANLGAHRLIFEGLGLTLEAHGVTLGAFELQFSTPWGHLGSYGLDFGVSGMLKVVPNAPRILSC